MTPGELGHETRVSSGEIPAWELSIKLSRVTSQGPAIISRVALPVLLTPHSPHWVYDQHYKHLLAL